MCGGGNQGGGRGAKLCLVRRRQAGHPGRSRCAPGRAAAARVGAGGGARCTVTGCCAPRPRGDIHWPAGPRSASAPRAAHGSAAAQRPRSGPRFAPSYFGGRWETAGGWLRVEGGLRACGPRSLKSLFHRLFCALTGQPLEISEESYVLRSRGAEPRRVGIWSHKPSPAGVLGLVKRRLSWRGAVLPHKPQRKVWLFASSGRFPGGVGLRRRRQRRETTPQALAEPRGFLERAFLRGGCGCTRVNEEQRLRTRQPGGAGMPKPAGRRQPNSSAGEREGKQSLSNESVQLLMG